MADLDPYDQYEASFPMEVAGTCLQQVCYSTHGKVKGKGECAR